jgi:hypothetical protein
MDSATPNDCITDAKIQAKITSVMNAQGWTGGLDKIFVLYTSSGEGSCFGSTNASCAYVQYRGYHGVFTLNGQPVIYANIHYGNPTVCAGTQTFPNDPPGDVAANITSHEIMEPGLTRAEMRLVTFASSIMAPTRGTVAEPIRCGTVGSLTSSKSTAITRAPVFGWAMT